MVKHSLVTVCEKKWQIESQCLFETTTMTCMQMVYMKLYPKKCSGVRIWQCFCCLYWNTPPQTCIECPLEVSQKSDKANYMYSSDQRQPIVAIVWRNSVRESILQCVWDGSLQVESTNTTIDVCCQAPTCSGLNHSPLPQRRSYRTTHNILYKWVRNRWTFVSAKAEKLPQRRHSLLWSISLII